MSYFDAEIFAQAVLADAQDVVNKSDEESADVLIELSEMRKDIEATLGALEIERDSRRAWALRQDLEIFLPARKAAILSAATLRFRPETWAALDRTLALATRTTLIVSKAFLTGSASREVP